MRQSKGFGQKKKRNAIKLIARESVTDEGLMDLMKVEELKWFAEVTKEGIKQQCALIPFNNSKTKKTRISVRLLFCRPFLILLSQAEIDNLAKKATGKIYGLSKN